MSLKQELQVWADALVAFDKQDFAAALSLFQQIADTSRIFFNLGLIRATLGEHEEAVAFFDQAVSLDQFLAVGYFQSGVSQFLLGRLEQARRDFDDAFVYMRGNDTIDYEQLGLKFKLYSCEVLFNRGLCSIYLGRLDQGQQDLLAAQREKRAPEHSVIDEALADRGEGYTVFSVPVGVLFRPPDAKLRNLESRDFLGKAKVVAASDGGDLYVGFSGTRKLAAASAGSSRSGSSMGGGASLPPLSRSKTSAARLERSGDGLATPLRPRTPASSTDTPLRRSQTAGSVPIGGGMLEVPRRTFTSSPQPVAQQQLPTPPPSDEQYGGLGARPLPAAPLQPTRPAAARQTYGIASSRDIIDSYYTDVDQPPPPTLPLATRATGLVRPVDTYDAPAQSPSTLDRVATWAQQNALPSNPRPGVSPLLTRDNSGSSTDTSRSRQILFALSQEAEGGARRDGGGSRQAVPARTPSRSRIPVRQPSIQGLNGQPNLMQRPLPAPPVDLDDGIAGIGAGMLNLGLDDGRMNGADAGAGALGRSSSQASFIPTGFERRERVEMVKVRVKLRFKGDTRGMSITADTDLPTFTERVQLKFGGKRKLSMRYKDAENVVVSILDDDDWESAMDEAREAADGRPEGKLDILLAES
ncbi:hypothetical protein JCM10207_004983 [Rhodosporidiobolus poonsookiae]